MGRTTPTTIQLQVKTKERLDRFARKPETYDDAVNRALDIAERPIEQVKGEDVP